MLLMVDTGIKENVLNPSAPSRAGVVCLASCCSSRARGEHRSKSDIDLAVFGGDQVRFTLDVEERRRPCSPSIS